MTTEAQRAANRRNAEKSTGPRTEAGKRRVSRNAVTHGLDCADLLLPGEDGAALAQYRAAMIADHEPLGAEEQDWVERMVAAQWRFRRLLRAEKEVYANQRHRLGPNAWTGSCVIGDLQQEKAFAYLDRKDVQLSREYHRCSVRLEALQAQRRQGQRPEVVEEASVHGEEAAASVPVGRASAEGLPPMLCNRVPSSSAEGLPEASNNAAPDGTGVMTPTHSGGTAGQEITEQSQSTAVPGFAFRIPGDPAATGTAEREPWEITEQTQLEGEVPRREAA